MSESKPPVELVADYLREKLPDVPIYVHGGDPDAVDGVGREGDGMSEQADEVLVAKLTTAIGRVDQGSVGGYTFRRHVAKADLLPLVKALIAEAEDRYRTMDERHLNSCIWVDPGRQSGQACFGGTRVPVDPFMAIVEEAGIEAAQAFWPSVTDEHVAAGVAWRKRYRAVERSGVEW
jgi:uncharacterized protein (DUF433 family)